MANTNTRYVVSWEPLEVVRAACIKRGMKDDDGTSFWDWVEPGTLESRRVFPRFGLAVGFARRVVKEDVIGEVRIERERLERDCDDAGPLETWQADATWNIHEDTGAVTETDPDYSDRAAA